MQATKLMLIKLCKQQWAFVSNMQATNYARELSLCKQQTLINV
jgi:hypothetical protein